jgi:ABC-type transporter Mla subunit MlaD
MTMTFAMALELILTVLLAATLAYCVVLERRLATVRQGQAGLQNMIRDLNGAIAGAGASLRALKSAAADAADTLDDRLKRARAIADELAVLSTSGERIAQRFDRAMPQKASQELPSGNVMRRLETLKAVR